MSTKFAKFLEESKIDARRLLAASERVERLTREDRAFAAAARRKRGLLKKKDEAKVERQKAHSGRPVSAPTLNNARVGKPISGPAKTRLLRAVNRVLEQQKKKPVELRTLF